MIPLVAAVALASSAGAPSAVLPAGTYSYEIYDEGKPVAKSTIVIHNENGSLAITEATMLQGDPVATTRTIDPATFTTLKYVMTAQGSQDTVDVPSTEAIWHNGTQSKTLPQTLAGPSIVFDFFAGEYVAIPAMLHATAAKAFNVYCLCFTGFDVKPATIVPATSAAPAGVLKTDVSAAFEFDDAVIALWYDPATFILHAMDAPKAQFRILLQP
jgi:hypothetical protein